ncbi:HupE/UreJ family protein [Aestuariibius sp. 2305UL40-4]|uniref:HupE/UreJ family protein n=1 Tax=Aestuariibius violaceus TaxID=3234132 RepID=UPI00345ECF59
MALLLWVALVRMAAAHEVFPSIANFTAEEGTLSIEIATTAEAILAGIDLDGLEDTDAAENAADYDALRALPPEEIADQVEANWPEIAENIVITADGDPVLADLAGVEVEDVENFDLRRTTTLVLTAPLSVDAETVQIGWTRSYGDLTLRQNGVPDDVAFTQTLSGGEISPAIAIAGGTVQSGWAVFADYIGVGFDHIIPLGLDHILFVLGLFFLAQRVGPLLWQVTAFTLAHTITLALAALGIVNVPPEIVEPIIAASIVYVAVENILTPGLKPWRPAVVFAFGLLHGLGFASVLGEFGLPESAFIPALIGFNVGVEVGQLVVIAVAFAVSAAALRASQIAGMETGVVAGYIVFALLCVAGMAVGADAMPDWAATYIAPFLLPLSVLGFLCAVCVAASSVGTVAYRQFVAIPASAAIAVIGAWWVIERTLL